MTDERRCDMCGGETKNLRGMLQCQACGWVTRADSVPLGERFKNIRSVSPDQAVDLMRDSIRAGIERDGMTENPLDDPGWRDAVKRSLLGGRDDYPNPASYISIMNEIDRQMGAVVDHGIPIGIILSPQNYSVLVHAMNANLAGGLEPRSPEGGARPDGVDPAATVWQRTELAWMKDDRWGTPNLPLYISDDPSESGTHGINVKGRRRTRAEAIAAAERKAAMTPRAEDRWSDAPDQLSVEERTDE